LCHPDWGKTGNGFYGHTRCDPCNGIKALMHSTKKEMFITNLVFIIAIRVNAAGEYDARKAVQLLSEKDCDKALEFAGIPYK